MSMYPEPGIDIPDLTAEIAHAAFPIGQDGHHLLSRVYAAAAPPHLHTIPAIDVLRQVWVRHFYVEGKKM